MKEYPFNLFEDVGVSIETTAEDFTPTLHYVLENSLGKRNALVLLLRYRDNKTFDEIGKKFELTRQRTQAICSDCIDSLKTPDNIGMLTYGIKGYMEHALKERIEASAPFLAEEEKNRAVSEAYERGYENGKKDAEDGSTANRADMTSIRNIAVRNLPFSVRSFNCFSDNGIKTLGDILDRGDKLKDMRSFGKTSFIETMDILANYGVDVRSAFARSYVKFKL